MRLGRCCFKGYLVVPTLVLAHAQNSLAQGHHEPLWDRLCKCTAAPCHPALDLEHQLSPPCALQPSPHLTDTPPPQPDICTTLNVLGTNLSLALPSKSTTLFFPVSSFRESQAKPCCSILQLLGLLSLSLPQSLYCSFQTKTANLRVSFLYVLMTEGECDTKTWNR